MRAALILILILLCGAAQAQGWTAGRHDNGHSIGHFARGAGLTFVCFAPSPQGLSAFAAGAHETEPTAQGTIRLEFDPALIRVQGVAVARSDLILWVDGTGYRLPEARYSDFYGYWGVALGWDDPLFAALGRARTILLAPGQDPVTQIAAGGMAAALGAVQQGCRADWQGPAAPQGQVVTIPRQVNDAITQGCNAPASLPPDAIQAGDLDRDGTPDFVLDWGRIDCPGQTLNPFCGAANCSHYVFLSSRAYARPIDLLGTSVAIIDAGGVLGLGRSGTFSLCGAQGEFCARPLVWDGTRFQERP
ncbi:MAG: hypothetical protein AAFN94_04475 [Pseudomonadota bacterium]